MNPETYQYHLAEDFAKEEAFIRWVIHHSPDDQVFWENFLLVHPHKAIEIALAKSLVTETRSALLPQQLSEEEKLQMHWQLQGAMQSVGKKRFWGRLSDFQEVRWVAAIALLLACGLAVFLLMAGEPPVQMAYHTAYGETRTLSLPDGSIVRLNANSSLTFDANWEAGKDRNVWLAGEAYFDVKPKPETCARFSVHTHELVVQVLGTRFNVNSRQAKTRVVLNEGKITLLLNESGHDSIRMDPGDMVDYAQKEKRLVQRKVNAELHSSWRAGIQLFEKTPLGEIVEKMEEIYGVSIQLQDTSLQKRKMTIGIPVEDVGIAMETIESVLGLKISPIGEEAFIVH